MNKNQTQVNCSSEKPHHQTRTSKSQDPEGEDGGVEEVERRQARVEEIEKEKGPKIADNDRQNTEEVYSVFTGSRRWLIVSLVTLAGILSPLTANIYLPALPDVASDLKVTTEAVQLSVTVFMIFQGLSPLFLGSFTDFVGRRPVYLICLSIFAAANAALANTPNSYSALMVLRCIQATGSASVIAIGAGVIQDITLQKERAGAMGIMQSGNSLGPAIGPVIGGALAGAFGWRALFYFLLALGGISLLCVFLFLPETLRKLVGNGSHPCPTIFHESFFTLILGKTASQKSGIPRPGLPRDPSLASMSFWNRFQFTLLRLVSPLQLLKKKEITLCLLLNAIPYSCYYCLTTSLSTLLEDRYGLNTTQIGLLFLPVGIGASISPFINGKILDRSYRKLKLRIDERQATESGSIEKEHESGEAADERRQREESAFPLERARFASYPYHLSGFIISLLVYGWTINYAISLPVPIIFSFFNGFFGGSLISTFGVILVDYAPGRGASATACNNIFRCLFGAAFTSFIQPLINAISPGWAFSLLSLLTFLTFPMAVLVLKKGPEWRKNDREKQVAR